MAEQASGTESELPRESRQQDDLNAGDGPTASGGADSATDAKHRSTQEEDEDAKAKMREFEQQDELPSDLKQWPDGKAKFVTFGDSDDAPAPVDKKILRIGVHREHDSYKWWALSCTSLGMLLATINSGTLIIALPDLERSLHTSLLELVWVILVYMIASTVLVLSAGRLSDQFGRKRAYIFGFALFAAASLGAGFAGNGTQLILWRIVQGIGGSFLFANAAAIVNRVGSARALACAAIWSASGPSRRLRRRRSALSRSRQSRSQRSSDTPSP